MVNPATTVHSSTTTTYHVQVEFGFFEDIQHEEDAEQIVRFAIERVNKLPGHICTSAAPAICGWIFDFDGDEWMNERHVRHEVIRALNAGGE